MVRYDDPNVQLSAVIGLISAIGLFVVIVLLQAFFFSMEDAEKARKVYTQPYEKLQKLDASQLEQLNSYGWVSEPEGVVHISIDRAMDLMAAEAKSAD